jgi:hypothetical protein
MGRERVAAMVAELRAVALPGETVRANRIEILLVEREVGATETAPLLIALPRSSARRASHHVGIVSRWPSDCQRLATDAVEVTADGPTRGVVLPLAFWAGDKQPHESLDMGSEEPALDSIRVNWHFIVPPTPLSTKCVFLRVGSRKICSNWLYRLGFLAVVGNMLNARLRWIT